MGAVFFISGYEKLLGPVENFLYIIQAYKIVPNEFLEMASALMFPWIELTLGAFLILGIWLKLTLFGMGASVVVFLIIVGQAIVRGLPIDDCGCFGDLMHSPLPVTFSFDILLLTLIIILYVFIQKTSAFSLDNYFVKKRN